MSKELLDKIKTYKDILDISNSKMFDDLLLCKVAGVTFDNCQEVIEKVEYNTPIMLERDRRNEHDFYAVIVKAWPLEYDEPQKVGFVPASMNKDIAAALDAGLDLQAKVWKKVGGESDFFHGLTITITRKK